MASKSTRYYLHLPMLLRLFSKLFYMPSRLSAIQCGVWLRGKNCSAVPWSMRKTPIDPLLLRIPDFLPFICILSSLPSSLISPLRGGRDRLWRWRSTVSVHSKRLQPGDYEGDESGGSWTQRSRWHSQLLFWITIIDSILVYYSFSVILWCFESFMIPNQYS
jgi:hypothetical protein